MRSPLLRTELTMVDEQIGLTGRRWMVATMASAGLLMVTAPCVAWAQTPLAASTERSSSERGVTVKVSAKSVGQPGSPWEFAVVLDTHSADLSDDLAQSATLTTDDGRTFKPTGWLGAPPGGHHREGVLVFDVPTPRPGVIELRIDRPGESAPRTFRWQL
jgi:hypothetical protein